MAEATTPEMEDAVASDATAATALTVRSSLPTAQSAARILRYRFSRPQDDRSTASIASRKCEATGRREGTLEVAVAAASSKSHKKDPSGSFLMGTREGRFYYAFIFLIARLRRASQMTPRQPNNRTASLVQKMLTENIGSPSGSYLKRPTCALRAFGLSLFCLEQYLYLSSFSQPHDF